MAEVMKGCALGVLLASAIVLAQTGGVHSGAPQAQSRTVEGVAFAPDASLLFLTPEQQRVAYRNVQALAPTNLVARGQTTSPLSLTPVDLAGFRYVHEGRERSLDDFMKDTRVAGLLVIAGGTIAVERYAQGHGPDSVWTSFSVAKSVVSLLYGAALQDGTIRSLDDPVTRYLPALRGSVYDAVNVRQLLQMSSGVAWNEEETDPASDLAQSGRAGRANGLDGLLDYMKRLTRRAPAGTVWNYSTGETHLAGALLRAASGRTLAQYLSEKIWQPAGMETDAYWLLMRAGDAEFGGCCLSASLRDFGRLGLFALRGGVTASGRRLVPANWMSEATSPAPAAKNYGYLWWLEPEGRYSAQGIFGQSIHLDPRRDTVVVLNSLWPVPINRELTAHRRAFVDALTEAVRRRR